jgi:hypothetical protein
VNSYYDPFLKKHVSIVDGKQIVWTTPVDQEQIIETRPDLDNVIHINDWIMSSDKAFKKYGYRLTQGNE